MAGFEFAKALYNYSAEGEDLGLPFVAAAIIVYLEDRGDGWSKGAVGVQEGWFPTSYIKKIQFQSTIDPPRLAAVVRSTEWMVLATEEDKIYFVNKKSKETSWEMPSVPVPQKMRQPKVVLKESPEVEPLENGVKNGHAKYSPPLSNKEEKNTLIRSATVTGIIKRGSVKMDPESMPKVSGTKGKKVQQFMINGVTFPESDKDQKPLCPGEARYCDYFWGDSEVGTGYDVILQSSAVGKNSMKEMAEFLKERAIIEEQYSRSLLKLSKSTFGDQEEGTLGRAWQTIKGELGERAKFHATFANELTQEVEKPLLEYKGTMKQGGKEHVSVIEQSRKLLRDLDMAYEKAKNTPNPNPGRRATKSISLEEIKNLDKKSAKKLMADDAIRVLHAYNEALNHYSDNMIQALQEMEQQEDARLESLKKLYLKYIEVNVRVNESIAMSLHTVHDAVDNMHIQADREFFIRKYGTGRLRPVERDPNAELLRDNNM